MIRVTPKLLSRDTRSELVKCDAAIDQSVSYPDMSRNYRNGGNGRSHPDVCFRLPATLDFDRAAYRSWPVASLSLFIPYSGDECEAMGPPMMTTDQRP